MTVKPDIIEYIAGRLQLKPAGHEEVGLCPFHDDRHPSLYVNREKQVFLCRACQAAGDVIDFVIRLDGLTFNEACKALDIKAGGTSLPRHRVSKAATLLAHWLNGQHLLVAARCRELSRHIAFAQEISDIELGESLLDEWDILSTLHEDLANPAYADDLWALRESIELITADTPPEPLPTFPRLTDDYRAYLRSIVE